MFYFIRHGQTDWNLEGKIQGRTNISLNETGRQQALKLQDKIAQLDLAQIVTSDLIRARETAELIRGNRAVPLIPDERLREMCFGTWEGQPVARLSPDIWHRLQFESDQLKSESLEQAYMRVKESLSSYPLTDNILFVTHGAMLKIIAYYTTYPDQFDYDGFVPRFSDLWVSNLTLGKWDPLNPEKGLIFDEK